MKTASQKCFTILTSVGVEDELLGELAAIGVQGCSITNARGRGEHGARPGQWASGNIRVEVVVGAAKMDAVLAVLEKHRKHDIMVAWISDVQAFPAEKFDA